MNANERQVGGSHYSQAGRYQHWDFIEDHGLGYLEGYASKYLIRWDKKGTPVQDLEKSLHTTEKLLELCRSGKRRNRAHTIPTLESIGLFCAANKVNDDLTHSAIQYLFVWRSELDLEIAAARIKALLEEQPSEQLKREYDKDGKKTRTEQERPFGYDHKEEFEESLASKGTTISDAEAEVRATARPSFPGSEGSEDNAKKDERSRDR
jgi:hypothetical protein